MTKSLYFALFASIAACSDPTLPSVPKTAVEAPPDLKQLPRAELNFLAQERFLPLFWRADDNRDGAIDADELAVLWGPQRAKRSDYVDGHAFTPAFFAAYRSLTLAVDPADAEARRVLVRQELRGGVPTLVETDLSKASVEERAVSEHVFSAAVALEKIYARQKGVSALGENIPTGDLASRAMFNRNQGPWCETPQLEKNPACNALADLPKHLSGMYPVDLQADPKFCDKLAAQPNGKALMDHFGIVEKDGAAFRAVPYDKAYGDDMKAVAIELDAAAAAIKSKDEAPFKAYLTAAAAAFRTNDWEPANVAWVAMSGSSSRWYLRVGPDEDYFEPCAQKAGFAVSYARINPDSKLWRDKLEPVKGEMEKALAALTGPPYKARDVQFKLPDFIDIVLNAGDQRNAHGATIGESLPNWGPVAEKGGRTVAMTNLYTDSDSREQLKKQMASLFCATTNTKATTDPRPAIMSTVLHEATHNLGPAHDYAVAGKKDAEVFGGPLASTLEELKAQTGALYFSEWLVDRKLLTASEASDAHVRDVAWAFGHISRGMYEADGKPKSYSQLASIQLGTLWEAGALAWKADEKAANGSDQGCFELDLAKWRPAIDALAKRVFRIKGRGDKKDAEAMKADLVDAKAEDAAAGGDDKTVVVVAVKGGVAPKYTWAKAKKIIAERWLRAPKASFVYSMK